MNIEEISEYVWKNCIEIEFGNSDSWDAQTFTSAWAEKIDSQAGWRELREGWYWFCVQSTYKDLCNLGRPPLLPAKACDISQTTLENKRVFGDELLCNPCQKGWLTIYNGHEKSIKSRVRSHFSLNNDRTGALGLIHYPVSSLAWRIRMFSEIQIGTDLTTAETQTIKQLIRSKSGRCAVESAWRVKNGWPVLCKE